jgi:type IV pilus assembly protein PilW
MNAMCPPDRQRGFSLIELMVSVVIGMLALGFAVKLVSTSEATKNNQIGGSDSMQNGMIALFSMSKDAAQAGFGLNDPIITGCDTVLSGTSGYAMAEAARGGATVHPLAPVVIESNGQNPDRVTFYAGSAMAGTGSMRVLTNYTSAAGNTSLDVDRAPYGFAVGDVIVVAPEQPGGQCALAQISVNPNLPTSPPTTRQIVQFGTGADFRFNGGQLGASFLGGAARLFDLGPGATLSMRTWSVANGFLMLRATDVPSSSATGAAVSDNIVSIKAQYGFDTRAGSNFAPGAGLVISQWSSTMIDADGDAVVGGAGDYARIAAVRIAVVARSKVATASVGNACTATTAQPTVFGTGAGGGAAAVPVTVNVAVAGDSTDWRCYRYRVFDTIIPLRNFAWRPA